MVGAGKSSERVVLNGSLLREADERIDINRPRVTVRENVSYVIVIPPDCRPTR
jgi:hypothetical protein